MAANTTSAIIKHCIGPFCGTILTLPFLDLAGHMVLGAFAAQVARVFVEEQSAGRIRYRPWPQAIFGALVALVVALLMDGQTPHRMAAAALVSGFVAYPILAITARVLPERYRGFLTGGK